jgi:hypothetical protein
MMDIKDYKEDLLARNREGVLDEILGEYEDYKVKYRRGVTTYKKGEDVYISTNPYYYGIRFRVSPGWDITITPDGPTVLRLAVNGCVISVEDVLGKSMRDVFNLEQHEYGILKLKCGLTKDMLWVPSVLKPFIRGGM